MPEDHHLDGEPDVDDPHRQWFISRCAHGDVHVGLGRVVVTLDDEEFDAFWRLICRAREHFGRKALTIAPGAASTLKSTSRRNVVQE